MNRTGRTLLAVALAGLLVPAGVRAEKRAMDLEKSRLTIRVYRAGFFSAFGHNHEVAAPLAAGMLELTPGPRVELRVDARKLRVLDPEASADTRAKIQKTMEGPQVLDSSRFPEIAFRFSAAEKAGAAHWVVRGELTLHGQTHPVLVDVTEEKDGVYRGSATLRQRDFGIKPVSLAGGTVKVKDEVKIEFEIVLRP